MGGGKKIIFRERERVQYQYPCFFTYYPVLAFYLRISLNTHTYTRFVTYTIIITRIILRTLELLLPRYDYFRVFHHFNTQPVSVARPCPAKLRPVLLLQPRRRLGEKGN